MRRRTWTAPPGWPAPPPEWQPPAGWVPDPSWPPAPADWNFWPLPRRTTAQRFWLAGAVVGAVLLVALVGTEVADQARGCGSIDPTDTANYSSVEIVNDTKQTVVIGECRGAGCHPDEPPARLAPGQAMHDQAGCGETGNAMTSWSVTTPRGARLGYIAVDSPDSAKGLVYRVSRASEDRSTATPRN